MSSLPTGRSLQPGVPLFLRRFITPLMWHTTVLFAINMVTNGLDYVFHFYLGWTLLPADFAIVQTVNSALLIVITVFGMMQPVVARFVATSNEEQQARSLFQTFFWQSSTLGLGLTVLTLVVHPWVGQWLNVPPAAIIAVAGMAWLSLTRPVVAGMLQAQERFAAFGWTRALFALVRLGLVALLFRLGLKQANVALLTLPVAALVSLLAGLGVLGRSVWQKAPRLSPKVAWDGWRLSLGALVATSAFMFLQSIDVIWVNRTFSPDDAAAFASIVLFRRLLAVLPTAVVVIMYPRAAALVAQGQSPGRLLWLTALVVTLPTLFLTLLYFVGGEWLVAVSFAGKYPQAAPLLGWMGLTMLGYGLVTMWLNFFLATRPLVYVILLVVAAAGQTLLLVLWGTTLSYVVAIFGLGGLFLALAGFVVYRYAPLPRPHNT